MGSADESDGSQSMPCMTCTGPPNAFTTKSPGRTTWNDSPAPSVRVASGGCPDSDRDGILDRNDKCPEVAGLGAFGCPSDTDDKVIAYVDGKKVATTYVMTLHGNYAFKGSAPASEGRHTLKLVWYSGSRLVKTVSRRV